MRRTYSFKQRLLAMLLCIAMVAAYLPGMIATASAARTGDKTVDPSTIHGWQQYFGPNVMSTEYAGGVWTDKSVFASFADYQRAEGVTNFVSPAGNALSNAVQQMLATDPESFLIALSAITANKSVSGSSSSPLDTMLVLDVSGSMQGNNAVAMVQATNEAIETLLKQNTNNRIGVVLYSGNHNQGSSGTGTASVLLPLGRYTTRNTMDVSGNKTIPAYLTISGSGNGQTVSVASSVNNGNNTDSKTVRGGTYIQNGLYQAWEEFEAVTDTKVPAGQVQAGAQRTPVVILMSDGAPTAATSSYNNIGTSNLGDGTSTNNRIAFMTQLTAAWVRSKIGTHYNTTPLFYTLGIGTGNSTEATSVLDPAGSNETLNTYWSKYLSGTNGQDVSITTGKNSWSVYKDANVTAKNYVDKYWLTNDASGLIAAFQQIVQTMVLQAEKHSTLVEAEQGADLSGYVTFEDELGELIDVKAVKGLAIGKMLFTGAEMAKGFNEAEMGTVENPTAYGDEFINTVKERLGITNTATAQSLVQHAYAAGQLSYTSATEYSNYIGWYADEDGNYLGFWQESDGYGTEGAPAGAAYINKSYGYLGAQSSGTDASDMMHVVVMVHTRISDGHQSIVYKIPASLIPAVTYHIELNGNDPADVKSITRDAAEPLRLLVEVGLRDELNAVNLKEKIAEHIEKGGHVHENADGTYTFYTNRWGDGDGGEVNYDEPLSHLVTESHFHPALENERYYHVVDDLVYSDTNGTVYNGSAAPSGNGYYFARTYYEVVNGTAKYTVKYAPLAAVSLTKAQKGDSGWYIPAGTPHQLARFANTKANNATGTLTYSWNPVVLHDSEGYNSYAFLGNNGSFTIAPAQGIALTKTVTQVIPEAPTEFTFRVTLSQAVADPLITDTDGNALTDAATVDGNVITVKLAADETVVISNLPTGITYTVEEEATGYYTASITNATGTIAQHTVTAVAAVNQPVIHGDLIISKDVLAPAWMTDITALENQEFTIRVTITGAEPNTTYTTSNSVTFDTNEHGTESRVITLKDGQSLTIYGLPAGSAYSVVEENVPAGHTANATALAPITGIIPDEGNAVAGVTNTYAPAPAEVTINLTGTKTFLTSGGNAVADGEWPAEGFIMELYLVDLITGEQTLVKGDIQATAADKTWSASVPLSFDKTGVYNYEIVEKKGTQSDITYDNAEGVFQIVVTDDASGALKISQVVAVQDTVEVTGSGNSYTVDKDFTNYKDAGSVSIPVQKIIQGSNAISVNDFVFGLYDDQGHLIDTVIGNGAFVIAGFGEDFQTPKQYTIREIIPDLENQIVGMTYDDTVYNVSVQWVDASNALEATVAGTTDNVAVFTNIYTEVVSSPSIELSGNKAIAGDRNAFVANESYTIQLHQTDASFTTNRNTLVESKVVSGSKYDFDFAGLTFNAEGVYYFVVKEVAGNQIGVTYDETEYHVTIHVVKTQENGTTELKADAIIHKLGNNANVAADALNFTNIYTNNDEEELVIAGVKYLRGRELVAGEFEFGLYEGYNRLQTVKNRANGTFAFAPITYTAEDLGTHTYTVREIIPANGAAGITYDKRTVYTVVVEVTDDGMGGLNATKTVNGSATTPIAFTNIYKANSTSATILGTKTLYDVDANKYLNLEEGQFTFELYDSVEDFSVQGDKTETTNDAAGNFSFTLNYSVAGDYYYILREKIGDVTGMEYDASRYLIRVRVSDDGSGQLYATVFVEHEGVGQTETIIFGNRYDALPSYVAIVGSKVLEGGTISDGMFDFELYEGEQWLQTVSNVGNSFAFDAIEYTKAGVYTYTVKEVNPAKVGNVHEGVVYDTTVYTVTVTVIDNNGTLEATVSHNNLQLVFINAMEELVTEKEVELQAAPGILIDNRKVEIGDILTYTISYTNWNRKPTDVTIIDTIPQHTVFVEGTAGEGIYDNGVLTWTLKDVPAYETVSVSFAVEVTAAIGNVTNKAQVLEGDNNFTTNETVNPVVEDEAKKDVFLATAPTVSIDGKKVNVGDVLQYEITYRNADDAKATVTITDAIPEYTTYVEGSAAGATYADGVLTWTLELDAGEMKSVTFQVKVEAPNVFIHNKATALEGVNSYETNQVTNYTHEEVVTKDVALADAPSIEIDNKKVEYGDILVYTVTYTNFNGETANVTVIDTIPEHTAYVEGSAAGATYADGKLTWNLAVPAYETVSVSFQVKVEVTTGTVTNKAQVLEGDNRYITNETVNPVVEDEVKKDVVLVTAPTVSIDGKKVNVGDVLQYEITYRNADDAKVTVTITDAIPEYTTYVEGSAAGATYADGVLTWTLELGAGETKTVTFLVTVDAPNVFIHNKATAVEGTNSYETNQVTNYTHEEVVTKDVALADAPSIEIDNKKVENGDILVYTVTYTNFNGETANVTVIDTIPAHTAYVEGSAAGATYADGKLTWNMTVPAYETVSVSFQVKVEATAGTVTNKAQVLKGNNRYITNETVNPVVEDKVKKDVFLATAPTVSIDGEKVNVGDILLYEITYTNSDDAAATVTITDTIPEYTTYVEGSAGSGVYEDGVLTWTLELGAGETKTVTFLVTVDAPDVFFHNKATAVEGANSYETNRVTNHTVEDVTTKDVALADEPTVNIDGRKVELGDVLVYTVTYTNCNGQSADVTITDTIPEYTVYVEGTAGDGIYADGKLTWNMTVPAYQTVSVSFQVKVEATAGTVTNKAQVLEGNNRYITNETVNPVVEDEVKKDVFLATAPTVSIDDEKVNVGDILRYEITYTNADDAAATVTITDTIPEYTTYVDGSAADATCADGILTWTLELGAGETKTVTFQVTAEAPDVFIDNKATAVEGENSYETNQVTNHTYEEVGGKDVVLADAPAISIDGKMVQVGQILEYVIDYTNTSDEAVDVIITDVIPEHTKLHNAKDGTVDGNTITWLLSAVQPRETVTVSFQVEVTDPGEAIENQAQIFDGTNKLTNKVVNSVPVKTVDKQNAALDEILTYTISYTNETGAPAKLVVTDKLPEGLVLVEGTAGDGVYSDGVITWTVENVPAGETVTVSFQAKVTAVEGVISNTAQIFENETSAVFTNESVTDIKKAELSIKKEQAVGSGTATTEKLNVKADDVVTYIITITNSGEGNAYGITVTDKLPEGLVYVDGSVNGNGIVENGTVTWTLDTLAAGESAELIFKVKVPAVEKNTQWNNVATLVYKENPTDSNQVIIEQLPPTTPQTGDSFNAGLFISLMVLSSFGIAAVMVGKKHEQEEMA